jgi:Tat protein secretion system quality control protein TatD with DNase activity
MLNEQTMRNMPDDQLVRALHAEFNPITSTPAEQILLERLENLLDTIDNTLTATAEEYGFAAKDIKTLGDAVIINADRTAALLSVIGEAGIDDPQELKTQLEAFEKFCALAEDAGDVFTRLSQLTTTVQE